ncbi:hypothetical protein D3C76_1785810 [compost metagenome]
MSIRRDLSIERLVIGSGNDQLATVEVTGLIATAKDFTTAVPNQLGQLRFDLGRDHPQHRAGIGQQTRFAQGNLAAADNQHTAAA